MQLVLDIAFGLAAIGMAIMLFAVGLFAVDEIRDTYQKEEDENADLHDSDQPVESQAQDQDRT